MIGIVLSGGKSTRMGTDKGLMVEDGLNWAQVAYSKLQALVDDVYVSVRPMQVHQYASSFGDRLIADDPSLLMGGPVLGLLSAHLAHPGQDIIVLACDMPRMDVEPMQYLLDQYKQLPEMETWLFVNENGLQPLMAIYSSALLEKRLQDLKAGNLTNFSVKHLVDISKSYQATVPSSWQKYFVNYNTHEDMHADKGI